MAQVRNFGLFSIEEFEAETHISTKQPKYQTEYFVGGVVQFGTLTKPNSFGQFDLNNLNLTTVRRIFQNEVASADDIAQQVHKLVLSWLHLKRNVDFTSSDSEVESVMVILHFLF